VCHFSRACSYNTVSGAAKLKAMYDAKRPHYVGAATDNSFHFDAELVKHCILDRYGGFLLSSAIYTLRSVVDYYVNNGSTVGMRSRYFEGV